MASSLKRLREIGWRDRLLLAEAAGALAFASVAIAFLPFRTVVRLAGGGTAGSPTSRSVSADIERVRWAVEACGRRLPWRIVCFQKGLALHSMLRRRGVGTVLHYGVAQDLERGLSAHVWVTYAGQPVIGGREAEGYTCLATYPTAAPR